MSADTRAVPPGPLDVAAPDEAASASNRTSRDDADIFSDPRITRAPEVAD